MTFSGIGSTEYLILFVLFCVTYLLFKSRKRADGLPPGPISFPIVGNLFQLGFVPHKTFMEMKKKYGPIFSIDFASYKAVVINDAHLIKKCFSEPAFQGRPNFEAFFSTGILMSESEYWQEQRRFALRNLRDFGFGKKTMEGSIQEDVKQLIEKFKEKVEVPVSLQYEFNLAVVNSLWKIISGEELEKDDPKIIKLVQLIAEGTRGIEAGGVSLFFPSIAKMFPKITGYSNIVKFQQSVQDFVANMVATLKATFQPEHKRHLIDAYFKEIQDTKDPESSFYQHKGEHSMNASIRDLFNAGSETTSTTLTWACLILALHPEIQEKLHNEIISVVGTSRLPSLEDKLNMPYTECFIMELLRFSSVLPLGVWHKATEDVEFEGYKIPKNTMISPNLYGVMHDPEVWIDPESIRPERFLLPDGRVDRQNEAFIPFSTGKRECLGAPLTKIETFMFITGLCQHFRFDVDPTKPKPTLESTNGMLRGPLPHFLVIHERTIS